MNSSPSKTKNRTPDFVFFGTDEFAVTALETLRAKNLLPVLVVTTPDQRRGRGLKLQPPPVKLWAQKNNISYSLKPNPSSLFVVASYGQILPPEILALPARGTLNIHPSLLPKYRGPSPIQTAILNGEEETGVSIMLVDEKMDHGAVLRSQKLKIKGQKFLELRKKLAKLGAELLIETIPDWVSGKIKPQAQDETQATYTKKIKKEDGLIKLDDDPLLLDRKFRALTPWPGLYFFNERGTRLKITTAHLDHGKFIIDRVVPESGKEIAYRL